MNRSSRWALPAAAVVVAASAAVGVVATTAGGGATLAARTPDAARQPVTVLHPEDPSANAMSVAAEPTTAWAKVKPETYGFAPVPTLATGPANTDRPASTTAAGACLTGSDIAHNLGFAITRVDWANGKATLHLAKPICAGVPLSAAGGQYAFDYGSKVEGSTARPNLPRFPQTRVSYTSWQPVRRSAGDQVISIPPVRNQCTQNDIALSDAGGNWPATLAHLGVNQPHGIGFYVGNASGCFPAPGIRVAATCQSDCTGQAPVTFTASTASPYGSTRVWWTNDSGATVMTLQLGGTVRTKTATLTMADGSRIQAHFQITLGASGPGANIGGVVEVRCPPVPTVAFTVKCLCTSELTGTVTDENNTRYQHVVYITVAGKTTTVRTSPHSTLPPVQLSWHRGDSLTVSVLSQLNTSTGWINVGTTRQIAKVVVS